MLKWRVVIKDWAAVRREERRELPQPVVIVRRLYAGRFGRFGVFVKIKISSVVTAELCQEGNLAKRDLYLF